MPTSGERLLRPALVDAVDEFFARLYEEMDFENELTNLREFGAIYGKGGRAARALASHRRGGAGGRVGAVPDEARRLARGGGGGLLAPA